MLPPISDLMSGVAAAKGVAMTSILDTARAVRALKCKSPSRRTKNEQSRYRGALLASCAFTAGVLALSAVPAIAGCNSAAVQRKLPSHC
jgi:hypothetical protein